MFDTGPGALVNTLWGVKATVLPDQKSEITKKRGRIRVSCGLDAGSPLRSRTLVKALGVSSASLRPFG